MADPLDVLGDTPPEVWWQVFERLSPADRARLSATSQGFRALVQAFEDHQEELFNAQTARLYEWVQSLGEGPGGGGGGGGNGGGGSEERREGEDVDPGPI